MPLVFIRLCLDAFKGFALLLTATPLFAWSSETLTPEPDASSYNFVTHYRVEIDARIERVWPVLLDFKAWMYDFELATVSGIPGVPGHLLNLYEGQDFKLQVTAVAPNNLVAVANLPMDFQGEFGTGVGIFTLHEIGTGTEVALSASRRYTWKGDGENPLQTRRSSEKFQRQTRAMWQRFLGRLKHLVEESASVPLTE